MSVYIHKSVTGLDYHLLCKSQNGNVELYKTTENLDYNNNIIFEPGKKTIIDEISTIYNLPNVIFPPENYLKAIQVVLNGQVTSDLPWKFIMPQDVFMRELRHVSKQLVDLFDSLNISYYRNTYNKTLSLFNFLQPAKINQVAYKFYSMATNKSNFIETFIPDMNGYAKKTLYTKCGTKTGRLKVISGPNILQIKKEERAIIESRFGQDGKIYMLDFKSLEPRIAWIVVQLLKNYNVVKLSDLHNVENKQTINIPKDLYSFVLDKLELREKGVTREVIKDTIIAQLYGASSQTLYEHLNGRVENVNLLIDLVSEFFGIGLLKEKLFNEFSSNNGLNILSYYGRPINALDAAPYTLVNYFIQPTAVDVALLGFQNFVSLVESQNLLDKIVPIFVLHDALFVDVHNEYYDFLTKFKLKAEQEIPGFEFCDFPIEISSL